MPEPDDLPARFRLFDPPTPLERLGRIGAELGHPALWVKRDDAMPLGLGGNKLRSLEFWVGEALRQGADTLVVAGQAVSNQCRLTAAAAARAGLGCVILHNSDPPSRIEGNLLLSHLYGAEIAFLGPVGEAERAVAARARVAELERQGRRPYLVGDPVLGAIGYVAAARELLGQAAGMGVRLAHVVVPGSMGPTEAGLIHGLVAGGFAGRVHVISVEYPRAESKRRVDEVLAGLAERLGPPGVAPATVASFDNSFLAPGYGIAGPAATEAMRRFARTEALLLEPTYTAKPFAALLALVATGVIGDSEPACILHTGGVPSLFAGAATLPQRDDGGP